MEADTKVNETIILVAEALQQDVSVVLGAVECMRVEEMTDIESVRSFEPKTDRGHFARTDRLATWEHAAIQKLQDVTSALSFPAKTCEGMESRELRAVLLAKTKEELLAATPLSYEAKMAWQNKLLPLITTLEDFWHLESVALTERNQRKFNKRLTELELQEVETLNTLEELREFLPRTLSARRRRKSKHAAFEVAIVASLSGIEPLRKFRPETEPGYKYWNTRLAPLELPEVKSKQTLEELRELDPRTPAAATLRVNKMRPLELQAVADARDALSLIADLDKFVSSEATKAAGEKIQTLEVAAAVKASTLEELRKLQPITHGGGNAQAKRAFEILGLSMK